MSDGRKTLNQSLERALDVLELLARDNTSMRSVEVARALDIAPNTANNMLRTLYRRGYLAQDEAGRYYQGAQCFFLGQNNSYLRYLRLVALPVMRRFTVQTGDNAFLGIEQGGRLYMAAHVEGMGTLKVDEKQQWQTKMHCTGAGKVILAEKGVEWFRLAIGSDTLPRYTDQTITDFGALADEIQQIRRNGYAACDRESCEDLYAIGTDVRDRSGRFVAALAQSFPAFYVTAGRIDVEERIRLLRDAAAEVGQAYSDNKQN